MTIRVDQLEKYVNPVFVETGTYLGEGVQKALDVGFETIISIEVSPKFVADARKKFANNSNVRIVHGDSSKVLGKVTKEIETPITFWLDAHNLEYASDIKVLTGQVAFPLIGELAAIKKLPCNQHTILMDDISIFKAYKHPLDEIVRRVRKINPHYEISFISGWDERGLVRLEKEIMVCEVK